MPIPCSSASRMVCPPRSSRGCCAAMRSGLRHRDAVCTNEVAVERHGPTGADHVAALHVASHWAGAANTNNDTATATPRKLRYLYAIPPASSLADCRPSQFPTGRSRAPFGRRHVGVVPVAEGQRCTTKRRAGRAAAPPRNAAALSGQGRRAAQPRQLPQTRMGTRNRGERGSPPGAARLGTMAHCLTALARTAVRAGVAREVPPGEITAERVRGELEQVLHDPAIAAAASAMSAEIAAMPSAGDVADELARRYG